LSLPFHRGYRVCGRWVSQCSLVCLMMFLATAGRNRGSGNRSLNRSRWQFGHAWGFRNAFRLGHLKRRRVGSGQNLQQYKVRELAVTGHAGKHDITLEVAQHTVVRHNWQRNDTGNGTGTRNGTINGKTTRKYDKEWQKPHDGAWKHQETAQQVARARR
jgi:hypothetical protein